MLRDVLQKAGYLVSHPCGGRGVCQKCAVILEGEVSEPNEAERLAGHRLSCQARLLGDASVILPSADADAQIETQIGIIGPELQPMAGRYGAAVDIGTTTIAVKIFDLQTAACVGEAACLNGQMSVAADVMGRIHAACKGRAAELQRLVLQDLESLLQRALPGRNVDAMVLTGNTTMLYLLSGVDPEPLSHAPFFAEHLLDEKTTILDIPTYIPPCISAFVGADITCGILAAGMCDGEETAVFCDIGTNGEIALWHGGKLFVTSTAAGPAFEGAGISCGCGSIPGAIDKVWLEDNRLCVHTIGGAAPIGICGSGLLDAVAAGLRSGRIDETGAMEEPPFVLWWDIALQQRDIRAVQLAKAAIAAGLVTLADAAEVPLSDIQRIYIAGGFGSHLDVDNAAYIGLIPQQLCAKTQILGNAALTGAVNALLNTAQWQQLRRIASVSRHVDLGGNPQFNQNYIEQMFFA